MLNTRYTRFGQQVAVVIEQPVVVGQRAVNVHRVLVSICLSRADGEVLRVCADTDQCA